MEAFAEYMFKQNIHRRAINLSLEGIENNKDLFLFFIDLFCKGLVLCYGQDNTVDFDTLTLDKFEYIKQCMDAAGIVISLKVIDLPVLLPTHINSAEIDNEAEDLPLTAYVFKIYKGLHMYEIKFSLTHRV